MARVSKCEICGVPIPTYIPCSKWDAITINDHLGNGICTYFCCPDCTKDLLEFIYARRRGDEDMFEFINSHRENNYRMREEEINGCSTEV